MPQCLIGAAVVAAVLAHPVSASTLEQAIINVGSNFSTCLGPAASTNDGTEAAINCGGERTVAGFALPVSMSSQAFASANPNGGGLRVIVDIQNAINTGVMGPSNDPAQFNSAVGFTLSAETQDDVSFSAGALAVFTWAFHEHIVNLSGNSSFSLISETASFGFTPGVQSSDVFWSCDRNCDVIGTFVPGVGHVFDAIFTRSTLPVPFTPDQILHPFNHISLGGDVGLFTGPAQFNEHVELDFLDPVTVSAQVFDAQGNLLTNVTATSALGVNYLGNNGPTPEPGTLSLLALGLLAVIRMRRVFLAGRGETRS
jgi:hypothetical protein